jgi:hypothetical protein
MLTKSFYVSHKKEQNLRGIALTHDLIPVMDAEQKTSFAGLIGVTWLSDGEKDISAEMPVMNYYSPDDLNFLGLQNDVEEAGENAVDELKKKIQSVIDTDEYEDDTKISFEEKISEIEDILNGEDDEDADDEDEELGNSAAAEENQAGNEARA